MAGISCSAYYKYKDKIFEYSEQGDNATTINAKLQDNAGVLSSVMKELYLAGANILAVNQSKQNLMKCKEILSLLLIVPL